MRSNVMMAVASLLLGTAIATSAVLGPLLLNVIRLHVSLGMESQAIGSDLVSLVLAAPLAIAAGVLWWRGHGLAPVVSIGPAIYASYIYFQYITAPEYLRYDGNSEAYFPLFQGILLLSLAVAVVAWTRIDPLQVSVPQRGVRLATAWVLLGVGGLLGLAWSRSIYGVTTGTTTTEYLEHPAAFWLVRTMDLSIVIPVAIVTGIGLLLRQPAAVKAALAALPGVALLAASVGSMALAMVVRDDPAAEPVFAAVLIPAAVVMGWLTWSLWRAYLREVPDIHATGQTPREKAGARQTLRTTTV